MRGRVLLATLAAVCGGALLVAAGTQALHLRAGNLIVDGDGGFAPTALPKDRDAPIRLFGHGRIRTLDGTRPSPLRELVLELDKHGHPEALGLPKCTKAKLVATTTKRARAACADAIIGTGLGEVLIELPEQQPIEVSAPITIFNGPEVDGEQTAIGHAHLDYPSPTTYLVQAAIEKVNHGRYGYRIDIKFPKIVNDYGSGVYGRVTINRKWTYKGRTLSIANARCADGRLQARFEAKFKDSTVLHGSVFKRCTVRK